MKQIKKVLAIILVLQVCLLGFNTYHTSKLHSAMGLLVSRVEIYLGNYAQVDLVNSDKIKKANFTIINKTISTKGSGTMIKINDNYYILSCAHVMEDINDEMIAISYKDKVIKLNLIKYDLKLDLALYEMNEIPNNDYLQIGERVPSTGSIVYTIGNPINFRNYISKGIVSNITSYQYIMTNKVFYGKSGGAVIYRGKIVGVITNLVRFFNKKTDDTIYYSAATKQESLKEFLKEFYSE